MSHRRPILTYRIASGDMHYAVQIAKYLPQSTSIANYKGVCIMIIRYLGSVQATTRERQLLWDRPATTLRELLRDLALHYGPRFKYWILTRGNAPDQQIVVRINGRDSRYLDGADTPLQADDTISLASTVRLRPTW